MAEKFSCIILLMYDLTSFSLKDMTTCCAALRQMGGGATSMEEVAGRVVRYLYDHMVGAAGEKASALVRFFITFPYKNLDPDLRQHVQAFLGRPPEDPYLRCQTLLATAGVEPAWNDRRQSVQYKVLPLTQETVDAIPMFGQVFETFDILLNRSVVPDPEFLIELEQQTYNVVYVPEVVGSAYVPDQGDFVVPYGLRSLLGFYGMLPSGNLFTVLIFSKQCIPKETTDYFKSVALSVKMAILPFDETAVFAQSAREVAEKPSIQSLAQFRSQSASLSQLLNAQDQIVVQQSERIEEILGELTARTEQLTETNQIMESEIAENFRLRQQAAQAAVEKERNRLARDLHDSVTQALYSQTLYAEAAARQLEKGDFNQAIDHLRQLRRTAQQAMREMRLLIFELRPSALETEGLAAALQTRLEAVEGRVGLETIDTVDESIALSPELETSLYWIAQEALNNSLKYAQASKVKLSLTAGDGQVVLHIEDNGVGFEIERPVNKGGLGLQSMRERTEHLGGQLDVSSKPGVGTIIHVEVPNH